MERIDKIKLAIDKGYTYDPVSGDVKGPTGKVLESKTKKGYSVIPIWYEGKSVYLMSHHFAYYIVYGFCPLKVDHKDRGRSNSISNLRPSTNLIDGQNRTHKGYSKAGHKFRASLRVNGVKKFDKRFDTEEEARQAYLEAKKKYHPEYVLL